MNQYARLGMILGASACALSATSAPAQTVIPGVTPIYPNGTPPAEVRLSPDQVRHVLDTAAQGAAPVPVSKTRVVETAPCPTKPHGEMGMEAGTGGYGGMYGAAVVPLGCHASVGISIGGSTGGGYYRRRR